MNVASLSAIGIAVAVMLLACGEGKAPCPFAPVTCDAAAAVESALRDGDLDSLLARFEIASFTCPGPRPTALGEAFPLCDGALAGEIRQGYVFLNDSQGVVLSESALRNTLALASDTESSEVIWRIVALSCTAARPADCNHQFKVILGAVDRTTGVAVEQPAFLVIELKLSNDGGWRVTSAASGFFFNLADLFSEGGSVPSDEAHAIFNANEMIVPWRTS